MLHSGVPVSAHMDAHMQDHLSSYAMPWLPCLLASPERLIGAAAAPSGNTVFLCMLHGVAPLASCVKSSAAHSSCCAI